MTDFGVPREVRSHEHRAALTPSGVKALVQLGHRVWVERGAGARAGHPDVAYESAGAQIAYSRAELLGRASVVACVCAPEAEDIPLLRPGQVVFAFWVLPAAHRENVRSLQERGVTAVGMESIADDHGRAPVLETMSEIAGQLAVTVGAGLLLNEFGGSGILMGGAPGVPPAQLAILGSGVLGRAAARTALGAGAQVMLLDRSVDQLRGALGERRGLTTMLATQPNVEKALGFADLVLGAVAVRGERAPVVVRRPMLKLMKPHAVVMDLSIDMGGCFETSRPTSFPNPVYDVEGIRHFCVPNLPAVAARASTQALTNAILPYLQEVGAAGLEHAAAADPSLRRGVYLHRGACVHEPLARLFGLDCRSLPSSSEGRS